jgi:hypothetical protein
MNAISSIAASSNAPVHFHPPHHSPLEWIAPALLTIAGLALLYAFNRTHKTITRQWLVAGSVVTFFFAAWGTMSALCVHPIARGMELNVDLHGGLHVDHETGDHETDDDHPMHNGAPDHGHSRHLFHLFPHKNSSQS